MNRSSGALIAAPVAIGFMVVIRVLGIGLHVFIGMCFVSAALGLFGIARTAMRRRWMGTLFFSAWFSLSVGVALYVIHLWRTLPDR